MGKWWKEIFLVSCSIGCHPERSEGPYRIRMTASNYNAIRSFAALKLTKYFDPTERKKATLKQSGFSHLFSAKKYLETRYGQHLTYFDEVGVSADERLVGVVYLVPLGGIAVVVLGYF